MQRCELCAAEFEARPRPKSVAPVRFCSFRCRNTANARLQERTKGVICRVCGSYNYDRPSGYCRTCKPRTGRAERIYRRSGRRGEWAQAELDYMLAHYPEEGAAAVGVALGRSVASVRHKAHRLGCFISEAATQRLVHDAARQFMVADNPMRRPESLAKLLRWQAAHPEIMAKSADALRVAHAAMGKTRPSGLERRLWAILDDLGVSYEASVIVKAKFVVDVCIGNALIIEADGEYWHGHPRFEPLTERQRKQRQRDKARDAYLTACGYTVVRLWDSEITQSRIHELLTHLRKY